MSKKYKITNEVMQYRGVVLHRIVALTNFNDVKEGDIGGWIENERNLSQVRNCWIYDDAKVYGNAKVLDDAKVYLNANVYGSAEIYDSALVSDSAKVFGNATVSGNAEICSFTSVCDNASVCGNAIITGNTRIGDNAQIFGDAIVTSQKDYVVFKNHLTSGRYFTYTFSNKMWKVGCFYGSSKELLEKAKSKSNLHYQQYKIYVDLVKKLEELNNNKNIL